MLNYARNCAIIDNEELLPHCMNIFLVLIQHHRIQLRAKDMEVRRTAACAEVAQGMTRVY